MKARNYIGDVSVFYKPALHLHKLDGEEVQILLRDVYTMNGTPAGPTRIRLLNGGDLTVKEKLSEIITSHVAVKAPGQYWADPDDLMEIGIKNPTYMYIIFRRTPRGHDDELTATVLKAGSLRAFLDCHVDQQLLQTNQILTKENK